MRSFYFEKYFFYHIKNITDKRSFDSKESDFACLVLLLKIIYAVNILKAMLCAGL